MSRPADAYLRFFESLTPATLDRLDDVVTPDVRFRDPFNDVAGVDAMRRVLAKMFQDVDEPVFRVTHAADAGNGVCLVRFRDPFNDVAGVDAMRRVLAKMFQDVDDPVFRVTHAADAGNGVCLVRWTFDCRFRGRPWHVTGTSELHLEADGRVAAHIDHWDSGRQFYEKLPLIGAVLRFIRRRCAA